MDPHKTTRCPNFVRFRTLNVTTHRPGWPMSSRLLDSAPQSPRDDDDDDDDENPSTPSSSLFRLVFLIRSSEYKVDDASSSGSPLCEEEEEEEEFIILFSIVFPSSAIARAATPRRLTPNPSTIDIDPPLVVVPLRPVVDETDRP
jgi:hypothetical protein